MSHPRRLALLALLPAAALLAGSAAMAQHSAYTPGPHNISLPPDWEARFIRYATLDNAERKTIRNL